MQSFFSSKLAYITYNIASKSPLAPALMSMGLHCAPFPHEVQKCSNAYIATLFWVIISTFNPFFSVCLSVSLCLSLSLSLSASVVFLRIMKIKIFLILYSLFLYVFNTSLSVCLSLSLPFSLSPSLFLCLSVSFQIKYLLFLQFEIISRGDSRLISYLIYSVFRQMPAIEILPAANPCVYTLKNVIMRYF